MPEKPLAADDEKEAERRFNETLGRLVNTPHKPQKTGGKDRLTDSAKTKGKGRS